MADKKLKQVDYNDFSKGSWLSIAESLAPENSIKLGLNLDSDVILGHLITRKGITLIDQMSAGHRCLGLHDYHDILDSNRILFGAFSDGTNTDIYDIESGTKSLEDDTKDLKTSFLTYLNNCLRLNGTDVPKSFNGTSWIIGGETAAITDENAASESATFTVSTILDTIQSSIAGLEVGERVTFSTTGTLPAPLAINTVYYVVKVIGTSFTVATTDGGSKIDITDTGTGTHTLNKNTVTFTSNGHGLSDGEVVQLTETHSTSFSGDTIDSSLPEGFELLTNYYVINATTNTFQLSATRSGEAVNAKKFGAAGNFFTRFDTFDLQNMPSRHKYAIEFKDRIYLAGDEENPDRVDISGIANAETRTISWTTDNKFIVFEQEDGGGGITGLSKVPGYLLVFKKRSLKRYDGSSAYPEDMISQGAPSQESITVAKGMCFWINENGAWVTTGGVPKKISTYTVDTIIASITQADLENCSAGNDEEHVYFSIPKADIDGESHNNVTIKYNILQNTWDVRTYEQHHYVYTKLVDDTGKVFTVFGDDDGNVHKLNIGTDDNGSPITYTMITHDLTFGFPTFLKSISRVGVITSNVSNGMFQWRDAHKDPIDWKDIGILKQNAKLFDQLNLKANAYNFKITDAVDTWPVIIKNITFPEGIIVYESSE